MSKTRPLTAERIEKALYQVRLKYNRTYDQKEVGRLLRHREKILAIEQAFLSGKIKETPQVPLQELGYKLIDTVNPDEKAKIIREIAKHGKDATNILIEEFQHLQDAVVRVATAEGLGEIRNVEGAKVLVAELKEQMNRGDTDKAVNRDLDRAAIRALGEIGCKRIRDEDIEELLQNLLGKAGQDLGDVIKEALKKLNK